MMNILIIGDSHVGSIKRAWDEVSCSIDDVKLHFAAGRHNSFSHVDIKDGILSSANKKTSKDLEYTFGSPLVDVNKLNLKAVLLYGMGLAVPFGLLDQLMGVTHNHL